MAARGAFLLPPPADQRVRRRRAARSGHRSKAGDPGASVSLFSIFLVHSERLPLAGRVVAPPAACAVMPRQAGRHAMAARMAGPSFLISFILPLSLCCTAHRVVAVLWGLVGGGGGAATDPLAGARAHPCASALPSSGLAVVPFAESARTRPVGEQHLYFVPRPGKRRRRSVPHNGGDGGWQDPGRIWAPFALLGLGLGKTRFVFFDLNRGFLSFVFVSFDS